MLPSRRPTLLAAALAFAAASISLGAALLIPDTAHASTAIALSLPELVDRSEAVVVGIPKSRTSRWESGRIVSYTTVAIDTAVAGSAKAGDVVTVRTMGGVVDGIGQITHGEAVLNIDKPVMLFVRPVPAGGKAMAGSLAVVGMAQGVLPIEIGADKVARVVSQPTDLVLVPNAKATVPPKPAGAQLGGLPLANALTEVRTAWAARAKK
jgi:hypothetical protein